MFVFIIYSGKSVWLYYAIRRRLGLKLPTIWYKRGKFIRFTESGVSEDTDAPDFEHLLPEPLWCFIDSAEAPQGIPVGMSGHGLPGVFPIYVSSPHEPRWKKLQQSKTRVNFIMNPWTWEEMECA